MARPRTQSADTRSTQIRLPASLLETLDSEARARMVSRNWLIQRLLTEAVNNLSPPGPLTTWADPDGTD